MSGEIIQLAPTTNMIFEPMDLEAASPATVRISFTNPYKLVLKNLPRWCFEVSRCGMIYMEPELLGWHPLMTSWLTTLPKTLTDDHKQVLIDLFHRIVPPCLLFVRKSGAKELSPTNNTNLVRSLMNLLDTQVSSLGDETKFKTYSDEVIQCWLEGMFFFSLVWSVGGSITNEPGRTLFDELLRELIRGALSEGTKTEFVSSIFTSLCGPKNFFVQHGCAYRSERA